MIISEKGAGKSYSALRMAVDCAKAIAVRMGGTWKDYFPFNEETGELPNLGCVDIKDIVNMVATMKKHNVYVLDDIGVGLNARKWQSEGNIIVNDIVEIARTSRGIAILTCMDQSFVDRVIREIIGWHVEVSECHHKDGYNVLKILKSKKQFRTGKMHRVYIKRGGERLVRCIVEAPPPAMAAAYDRLRDRKTDELKADRLQTFNKVAEAAPTRQEKTMKTDLDKYGARIKEMKDDGMSINAIARELGCGRDKVNRLVAHV